MASVARIERWRSMRWAVILLAWAMVASVAIPSVAVADEAEGLEALRDANDAFDEENFEEAYDSYDEAYEILGVDMIKYRLGQTAEQLGWTEKAVAHYERYREIGDDEEFLSRIDEAMPDLREQLQVTVEIISDPEGASVSVEAPAGEFDDEQAPVTLTMEAGDIAIALSLEGYDDERFEETLEAGEEYVFEATLKEAIDEEPEGIAELDDPEAIAEPDEIADPKEADGPDALADFDEIDDVDDAERSLSTWGMTTTGVGVSLLAFGGVMSVFQSRTTDEVNALDRAAAGAETQSFEERQSLRQEQQDLRDDAQTYYRLSTGAYLAGGVLTAAGVGLLVHSALGSTDDGSSDGLSIRGGVTDDGGVIGIGGRF